MTRAVSGWSGRVSQLARASFLPVDLNSPLRMGETSASHEASAGRRTVRKPGRTSAAGRCGSPAFSRCIGGTGDSASETASAFGNGSGGKRLIRCICSRNPARRARSSGESAASSSSQLTLSMRCASFASSFSGSERFSAGLSSTSAKTGSSFARFAAFNRS